MIAKLCFEIIEGEGRKWPEVVADGALDRQATRQWGLRMTLRKQQLEAANVGFGGETELLLLGCPAPERIWSIAKHHGGGRLHIVDPNCGRIRVFVWLPDVRHLREPSGREIQHKTLSTDRVEIQNEDLRAHTA